MEYTGYFGIYIEDQKWIFGSILILLNGAHVAVRRITVTRDYTTRRIDSPANYNVN